MGDTAITGLLSNMRKALREIAILGIKRSQLGHCRRPRSTTAGDRKANLYGRTAQENQLYRLPK
jgi:hypothetical protein